MNFIVDFGLSSSDWALVVLSTLMVGMSKTGIQGIGTLAVPLLAFVFGAKPSTGVLLPMLCMADVFAVVYYRRHANFRFVIRLMPWAVVGLLLALWLDTYVPAAEFKQLIGGCILMGVIAILWNEYKPKQDHLTHHPVFAAVVGIIAGFTTMIGNAAGPIMMVYLLAMRLPKHDFVGTAAWYFLIVNLLKVPLQIIAWNNITPTTFSLNLILLPVIAVGAFVGVQFVRYIPEEWFKRFVIVVTLLSALMLF